MSRHEAYNAIIARIRMPSNTERYQACCSSSISMLHDNRIQWLCKVLTEYDEQLQSEYTQEIANSFDGAYKELNQILDDDGWDK